MRFSCLTSVLAASLAASLTACAAQVEPEPIADAPDAPDLDVGPAEGDAPSLRPPAVPRIPGAYEPLRPWDAPPWDRPIGPHGPADPADPSDPPPPDDPVGPAPGPAPAPNPSPPSPREVVATWLGGASVRPDVALDAMDLNGVTDLVMLSADVEDGRCVLPEEDEDALEAARGGLDVEARVHLGVRLYDAAGVAAVTPDLDAAALADSCVALLFAHDLDGILLALPHAEGLAPAEEAGADRAVLAQLVEAVAVSLGDEQALSMVVPAGAGARGLLPAPVMALVDRFHVAAFTFEGLDVMEAMPVAAMAPVAPLVPRAGRPADVPGALAELEGAGLPLDRVTLGVSLRGRAYVGVEPGPRGDGLHAPADGLRPSPAGPGAFAPSELAALPGVDHVHPATGAHWRYDADGRALFAFETLASVAYKRPWAAARGLAGIAVFDLAAAGDGGIAAALR